MSTASDRGSAGPSGRAHGLNAVIGVFARASSQIVTVVVTLYAARILAPAIFGTFAIAAAWITLVRSTFYSGAYEYLLKARDAREASSESLVVNVLVGLALTVPMLAVAPFSSEIFGVAAVGSLMLALAPSNGLSAVAAWQESLVLRTGRLRAYYLVTAVAEIASGAVAVLLLARGFGLSALVVQVYARNAIGLVGLTALRSTVLSSRFSTAMVRTVLGWSLSRYYSVFVNMGTTYAADIVLGIMLSPAASGLYRASNRIVTAVSDVIAQPARMIAMTAFSAMAADGRIADRQWASITTVAAVFGWSALGGLAVVGPMLVPAVLGPGWAGAAALVPVLCAARAMVILDALSGVMLVIYDHQRMAFRLQIVGAAVMLAALLISAPFGVEAATWGVLAASLAMSGLQLGVAWRRFPGSSRAFRRQAAPMLMPMLATVTGAFVAMKVMNAGSDSILRMAIAAGSGVVAWAVCIVLMRRRMGEVVAHLRADPATPSIA